MDSSAHHVQPPHPYMSSYSTAEKPLPYPKMRRNPQDRVIAGVAGGLAAHLGVSPLITRGVFTVLATISGAGIFAYAALWMVVKLPPGQSERKASTSPLVNAALLTVAIAGFGASATYSTGVSVFLVIALGVVGIGAFISWRAYDRGVTGVPSVLSIIAGIVLVSSGVLMTLVLWTGIEGFLFALLAVGLSVTGVAILVVPLVLRLWNRLSEEQAAKAAADERADIAAHLHDSVLQTLALIQKRSKDSTEVARLARAQERELRGWLFDAEDKSVLTVFAALEKACGEVEDMFSINIRPVTVGADIDLTDCTQPVVLAAREAMVNAAKHAQVDTIDVYAENLAGELSIFVRDRGVGFDTQAVDIDRHGISESIYDRMERADGTAQIKSTLGAGTEVMLKIPVRAKGDTNDEESSF
ncbi:MAG: PspC domain-containing protein [Corynebacterium sp.]|nr:PspC domain-containing protein [Corynebacterium sp.]